MINRTYLLQPVDWAMAVARCAGRVLEAGVSLCERCMIERVSGRAEHTKILRYICIYIFSSESLSSEYPSDSVSDCSESQTKKPSPTESSDVLL